MSSDVQGRQRPFSRCRTKSGRAAAHQRLGDNPDRPRRARHDRHQGNRIPAPIAKMQSKSFECRREDHLLHEDIERARDAAPPSAAKG